MKPAAFLPLILLPLSGCLGDGPGDATDDARVEETDPNASWMIARDNLSDIFDNLLRSIDPDGTEDLAYWSWSTQTEGTPLFLGYTVRSDAEWCIVAREVSYQDDGPGPGQVAASVNEDGMGWSSGSESKTVRAHAGPLNADQASDGGGYGAGWGTSGGTFIDGERYYLFVQPLAAYTSDSFDGFVDNATARIQIVCDAPFRLTDVEGGKQVWLFNEENAEGGASAAADPGPAGVGFSLDDGFQADPTGGETTLILADGFRSEPHAHSIEFTTPEGTETWTRTPTEGAHYEHRGAPGAVSGSITRIDPPRYDSLWIAIAEATPLTTMADWEAL